MTIHLPKDLEAGIMAAVDSGQFATLDDAMIQAASLLLERLGQQPRQAEASTSVDENAAKMDTPIWEEVQELTSDVPDEEWDKLPRDLAEQHDHYIYGTPKRPASP